MKINIKFYCILKNGEANKGCLSKFFKKVANSYW